MKKVGINMKPLEYSQGFGIMFLTREERDIIIEEAKKVVGKDLPEPLLLREMYGSPTVIKVISERSRSEAHEGER